MLRQIMAFQWIKNVALSGFPKSEYLSTYCVACLIIVTLTLLGSAQYYNNVIPYREIGGVIKTGIMMELNSTPMEDTTRENNGYILSLHSADQSTGGAWNVMSLQCLMEQIGPGRVVVVEPFIVKGVWGAHLSGDQQELARENNVRLSDIYDMKGWESVSSSHGYARLVRWEEFLLYAPRDLILVDFHWYHECSVPQLSEKLTPFINLYNFSVVKTVCFDFVKSGILSLDQIKKQLYGTYSPSSVSVIFSMFNGILEKPGASNRYLVDYKKCSRANIASFDNQFLKPSHRLVNDVHRYTSKYLSGQTSYLSIMIRLEHAIRAYGKENAVKTTQMCINHATLAIQKIQSRNMANKVFLTMDFGKYGSLGFVNGYNGDNTILEALMTEFFHKIFGQTLTFSEWEESFQNISGLTSGGAGPYIAGLQKAVASRGRCIILVGGGSFQESALNLYKEDKRNKDLCFIKLDQHCNQVAAVLP